jgi:hypothetical protein
MSSRLLNLLDDPDVSAWGASCREALTPILSCLFISLTDAARRV